MAHTIRNDFDTSIYFYMKLLVLAGLDLGRGEPGYFQVCKTIHYFKGILFIVIFVCNCFQPHTRILVLAMLIFML